MSRNAAYIRDNPNATGDCDWQDVTNNWRDADATWLQERSIARVATTPTAETALVNTNEGRVFYSIADTSLYLSTTGAAPFSRVLSSKTLQTDDSTSGQAKFGVSGHLPGGLVFDTATGNVTIGNLTVTSLTGISTLVVGQVQATGSVEVGTNLILDSGASNVVLSASGTTLVVAGAGVTAVLVTATNANVTGGLTVGGTTALGATVTASGTVTVNTSVTTPRLAAKAGGDLTIAGVAGRNVLFTAPTLADANFYYGTSSGPRLAWMVVNAADPGVANVPEGTIWIQP